MGKDVSFIKNWLQKKENSDCLTKTQDFAKLKK